MAHDMSVTDRILDHLKSLPESLQARVLDYVEFLEAQSRTEPAGQEDADWRDLSLAGAMRGMVDEDSPYTVDDLTEAFSGFC